MVGSRTRHFVDFPMRLRSASTPWALATSYRSKTRTCRPTISCTRCARRLIEFPLQRWRSIARALVNDEGRAHAPRRKRIYRSAAPVRIGRCRARSFNTTRRQFRPPYRSHCASLRKSRGGPPRQSRQSPCLPPLSWGKLVGVAGFVVSLAYH
jgi:hypothetical protein